MLASLGKYTITWEKLPDDFILDDEPVESIDQPLIAAALREILELAGLLHSERLVASNLGICATLDGKLVIKAPDWFYVSSVLPISSQEVRRSYTPNLEGEIPAIVMEFLSATDAGEYSSKQTYPPGKWFFYEQILQVPIYAIFDAIAGELEVYQLNSGRYQLQHPNADGRYWIEQVGIWLGIWQGTKGQRTGHWLRWWDESGQMLLWGEELVEQERQAKEAALQQVEQERQAKEAALQQVEELAAQLRALGGN